MSQATVMPEDTKKKGKKEKKGKEGKKEKKGGFLGVFIMLLLVLLALGGLVASVFFNWLGIRDTMIGMLGSLDPAYVTNEERAAALELKSTELSEREATIASDEARLAQLEVDLQGEVAEQQAQQTELTPLYRRNLPEDRILELQNLGSIYSKMDAASAAAILPELYTIADMATILFYMNQTVAAEVLAGIDADLAADITMQMLQG